MDTMAPTRPKIHPARHIPLTAGPAAPAAARTQVGGAIRAWGIPVDVSVAILLTSELVTNALSHEPGDTVRLVITCAGSLLRVDVHDTCRDLPVLRKVLADAEAGRGLMIVSTLSTNWGYYRTPMGKVVYFTLAFQADDRGQSGESSPRREQGRDPGPVR
jgi:hypothetical protein